MIVRICIRTGKQFEDFFPSENVYTARTYDSVSYISRSLYRSPDKYKIELTIGKNAIHMDL